MYSVNTHYRLLSVTHENHQELLRCQSSLQATAAVAPLMTRARERLTAGSHQVTELI